MNNEEWKQIKYFKPEEFDSKDAPGSNAQMSFAFLKKLDWIRYWMKRPIKINSGYRTKKHNEEVGGVKNSPHMIGVAADIHVPDSSFRFWLVVWSLLCGIKRIGIGKTFIHIDIDKRDEKGQNIIWLY